MFQSRCCRGVQCEHCTAQCVTCGEDSPPLGGHTTIHCSPTLVLTLISLNYSHKPTLNSLTESLSSLTDSTQTTTQRITQLAHRINSLLELLFSTKGSPQNIFLVTWFSQSTSKSFYIYVPPWNQGHWDREKGESGRGTNCQVARRGHTCGQAFVFVEPLSHMPHMWLSLCLCQAFATHATSVVIDHWSSSFHVAFVLVK